MRKKGRFATIADTAEGIMSYLCNVNHSDPEIKEAVQNLLKLMWYTDKKVNPFEQPDFNLIHVKNEVKEKQIRIVPEIPKDDEKYCFITVTFDQFSNTEADVITNIVNVDVFVPTDFWITNSVPRIFLMMDEIDFLLNKRAFSGLGVLDFIEAPSTVLNEGLVGYTMRYLAGDTNDR